MIQELDNVTHHNVQYFEEHGQEWAHCLTCGASWSVVDEAEERDELAYHRREREAHMFERIDQGDDYCALHPMEEILA